jgi:hypothetical protein
MAAQRKTIPQNSLKRQRPVSLVDSQFAVISAP